MASARRILMANIGQTFGQTARRMGPYDVSKPANLSELGLWLDGYDIDLQQNRTLTDAAKFIVWKNKGFLGSDVDPFQNTEAEQPVFYANRNNGTPGAFFSSSAFLRATANPHVADAPRHIFTVLKVPALTLDYYSPNESAGYGLRIGGSSALVEFTTGANSVNIATPPTSGRFVLVEVALDGNPAHLPVIYRIGGVDQVVSNNTGIGVGNEVQTNSFYLGYHFDSDIHENLAYTAVQTEENLLTTRAYMSKRWGVAA